MKARKHRVRIRRYGQNVSVGNENEPRKLFGVLALEFAKLLKDAGDGECLTKLPRVAGFVRIRRDFRTLTSPATVLLEVLNRQSTLIRTRTYRDPAGTAWPARLDRGRVCPKNDATQLNALADQLQQQLQQQLRARNF